MREGGGYIGFKEMFKGVYIIVASVVGLPPTIRNKFVAPCNSRLNLINIVAIVDSLNTDLNPIAIQAL